MSYNTLMGAIFIPNLILSTARTRGKPSIETEKSELNTFFTQYSLPSFHSATKSPLHTKLPVTVLLAVTGACVNLLHSFCSVTPSQALAVWFRGAHTCLLTWTWVVLITSETWSSHLQIRHIQLEQSELHIIVSLAFDLGFGVWSSVNGVSLTHAGLELTMLHGRCSQYWGSWSTSQILKLYVWAAICAYGGL